MLPGLDVGLWLITAALVVLVFVLVALWFRRLPNNTVFPAPSNNPVSPVNSQAQLNEATLVVQPGGRVEHVNDVAREWFGLRSNEPPELERLIRQVRPAEDFLNLCAAPGQRRLSIAGRLTEVTSHLVPGSYPLIFLTLRNAGVEGDLNQTGADSSLLKIISEFGAGVSASLELDPSLYSILLNVSHLVPSDILEVKIWDDSHRTLTPYILEPGGASGVSRVDQSQFGGLTDALVSHRSVLLVSDTRSPGEFAAGLDQLPVKSYLGVPLLTGGELVGTLEIGHLTPGALGQADLGLVQLVSSQAAHAIHNAMVHEIGRASCRERV